MKTRKEFSPVNSERGRDAHILLEDLMNEVTGCVQKPLEAFSIITL